MMTEKKFFFLYVFCAGLILTNSCSKLEQKKTNHLFETPESAKYRLALENGMLNFKSADLYNDFLALDDDTKYHILSEFEKRQDFKTQHELRIERPDSEPEVEVPLIMQLLTNAENCIIIQDRVYKVNDTKGKVYSISEKHLDLTNAINDLLNENEASDWVKVNSVEEDLFEIIGSISEKGVINNNCPTWANGPTPKVEGSILSTTGINGTGIINCDGYSGSRSVYGYENYYRGGILFSLTIKGEDNVSYTSTPSAANCTDVRAGAEFIFKRNGTSGAGFWSSGYADGYSGRVTYTIYSGANRLCYYRLRNGYIRFEQLNASGQNIGFITRNFSTDIFFNYI
jgi:hypothetical protein